MKARLLADENVSHGLVAACLQPKDPALLMTLRDEEMVLVGFDRSSPAHHADRLCREGVGHSGVILYRRTVSRVTYGIQTQFLVEGWREAAAWDWADRIVYLPRT